MSRRMCCWLPKPCHDPGSKPHHMHACASFIYIADQQSCAATPPHACMCQLYVHSRPTEATLAKETVISAATLHQETSGTPVQGSTLGHPATQNTTQCITHPIGLRPEQEHARHVSPNQTMCTPSTKLHCTPKERVLFTLQPIPAKAGLGNSAPDPLL